MFRLLIFIAKCKVAIVYELLGQPTYIIKTLSTRQSMFVKRLIPLWAYFIEETKL